MAASRHVLPDMLWLQLPVWADYLCVRIIGVSCPLTKLNGGLSRLHSADEDAVSWLTSYSSRHAYEKKKIGV